MKVNRVFLETPYNTKDNDKAKLQYNVQFALACMHDSYANHDEAPFASHLLYTRVPEGLLKKPEKAVESGHIADSDTANTFQPREFGMVCARVWRAAANSVVVYTNHGITEGMKAGIEHAKDIGLPVVFRILPHHLVPPHPQL